MSWEIRGPQRCFYHARRVDGRVVKTYLGAGPDADAATEAVSERRRQQRAQRAWIIAEVGQTAAADAVLQQLIEVLDQMQTSTHAAGVDPSEAAQTIARIRQLLVQRDAGDPELTDILDRHPELWAQLGDLGEQALELWLSLIAGPDALYRRAAKSRLEQLRAELAVPNGDVLAKLMVDRVLATWLQMTYADIRAGQHGTEAPRIQEFLARRQQQAQRQHLAALKAWRQWTPRRLRSPVAGAPAAAEANLVTDPILDLSDWILPFGLRTRVPA